MDDCYIAGNQIISDEEIVNDWDVKTSRKILCKLCICKNEKVLEDVLKDYVCNVQNQALKFKLKKLLHQKILKHVMLFYSCCVSFINIPSDMQGYWENMQSVLVILCNLELDLTKNVKITNNKEYCDKVEEITSRLVYILSVFLLNDNQKICHVLLKLDVKYNSKQWRDVMGGVYRHFLVMLPITDKSDENFCRIYLLFKSFKNTMSKKNHKAMDNLLFNSFGYTSECLKTNRTLRKVLFPQSTNSIIDVVDLIVDCRQIAIDNYFKYIEEKNREEDLYIPSSINLESDSEEDTVEVVPGGRNGTLTILVDDDVKLEDDECTVTPNNSNGIICLDDDSDVEEVSLSVETNRIRKVLNLESSHGGMSFLESITIPGETNSILETPPSSAETVPAMVSEEPLLEKTEPPLPFMERYLNDLRIEGQVKDTNQINFSESTANNNTEDIIDSSSVTIVDDNNTEMETESVSANKVVCEVLESATEVESENTDKDNNNAHNIQIASVVSNCDEKESESLSHDLQVKNDTILTNLTQNLTETIESSLLPLQKDSNCESNSDIESSTIELGKTVEKPLESPSNGYNFNLIHGLITPPISDRTNDDGASDINPSVDDTKNVYVPNMIGINRIRYEQLERDINNCRLSEKSISEIPSEVNSEDEQIKNKNTEENLIDTIESQEESQMLTDDDNLLLHESIDIQDSENYTYNTVLNDSAIANSTEEDLNSNTELEESNSNISNQIDTEHEIVSESLTPVDIIVEDYHLPSSDIISTNEHLLKPSASSGTSTPIITSKKNSQNHNFETYMNNVLENNTVPIFPSILKKHNNNNDNVSAVLSEDRSSKFNLKHSIKVNGDIVKVSKSNNFDKSKIIFTSSERVSAPLSVFSKFEQSQSQLIEKACSGPIQPISNYSNIHSDHSNSNDSLYSPQLHQPIPADSPISPPYEQIQAQDYENHVRSVKYNCIIKSLSPVDSHLNKAPTLEEKLNELPIAETPTIDIGIQKSSLSGRKRKHDNGTHQPKKNKVNFGGTEVRIIPPDNLKLIQDEVLQEATESMKKYNIHKHDVKLVYLQPQIPVKIESLSELQEKEEQLKIRGLLHNTAIDRLNGGSNTCIVKRVDYKKIAEQMNSAVVAPPEIRHNISNLLSKQRETTRLENAVPSGYIPTMNGYSSVHGLQSSNAMEQKQNFSNHQQNQTNTFNDNCNSEILNLSISSALNTITELDNPESEFSRSPKLLQNSVENLVDDLDNNEVEPIVNVPNNMVLLSNNSNFYSTPNQLKLPTSLSTVGACQSESAIVNDTFDKYKAELDELLLKSELDKLFDEKLMNCENETSLPLKKRRVVPKLNETVPPFKEISYPATPMMSIAEIEALNQSFNKSNRGFKTAAERKEMPPIPLIYNRNSSEPTPIIADQFNINNHTYNNPTINYHMNNVPVPFINVPCAPYYSFPPFIVPFNNVTPYDNNLNQDCTPCKKEEEPTKATKTVKKQKKEKKKQFTKSKEFFQQFVSDKKFIF